MKSFGPLSRLIALAGLFSVMLFSAPVMAAKADIDLLQSYIGSWKGKGVMIGAEKETVVCRLTLSQGNDDKVVYSGRCSMAGTNVSVNGALAYIDAKKRYEAAMTSNMTFSGTAIGQKSGGGLVFNLKEAAADEAGNDLTVTAQIALNKSKISVEFSVVFNATGDMIRASVPFTKG